MDVSSAAVEEALALCERSTRSDFVGPRSQTVIASAEAALGLGLPTPYRLFVERLGAGSIGAFEVYGVISEPFEGPIPDAVWLTRTSREPPSDLPSTMIVVGEDGMGGQYVLDTALGDDPPVQVWEPGASVPGERLEQVADDFGSFLLESARRATGA